MNHPNLQTILNPIYNYGWPGTGMPGTQKQMKPSEAIDAIYAIYAGLLAEVIGGGYPISAISSRNNAMQNTIELQAMEKLREAQTEALKRWCYGDNK